MSHTVLKSQKQRVGRSNALLNEISGAFEIYWEQITKYVQSRRGGTFADSHADDETTEEGTKASANSTHLARSSRPTTDTRRSSIHSERKNKFIDANVVFG